MESIKNGEIRKSGSPVVSSGEAPNAAAIPSTTAKPAAAKPADSAVRTSGPVAFAPRSERSADIADGANVGKALTAIAAVDDAKPLDAKSVVVWEKRTITRAAAGPASSSSPASPSARPACAPSGST